MNLPVIALAGKQPNGLVHPHGLLDAYTSDTDADWRRAFLHPRTTGVGIVIPFPYLVVDIDGEQGAIEWLDIFGDIPDRWVAKTARGLHMWYACWEPTGNGVLAPGLDLKGQGGYVAAPPSRHPSGHVYSWLVEPVLGEPPLEAPPALAEWIATRNFDRDRRMSAKSLIPRVTRRDPLQDGMLYATHNWDPLIEGMTKAPDGNRNNYLHWAAATMAEESATEDDLQYLFDTAVSAGLTRIEVRNTLRSAIRRAGR